MSLDKIHIPTKYNIPKITNTLEISPVIINNLFATNAHITEPKPNPAANDPLANPVLSGNNSKEYEIKTGYIKDVPIPAIIENNI